MEGSKCIESGRRVRKLRAYKDYTDVIYSDYRPRIKMPKRRASYTASFKLTAIEKAKEMGNRAAARELGVDERSIRSWTIDVENISAMPASKRARRYKNLFWPNLENRLTQWILKEREDGRAVSTVAIRLKAKQMATEMNLGNFTGNATWCYRFMKRHHLSVRSRTTVGQQLPDDWEEKVTTFRDFVNSLLKESNIEPSDIINMDEVPLSFDCPPARTVDVRGESTISIVTTGHERSSFTVALACAADGSKLKPLVIFKRKTMPKENFPSGIVVCVNEKGWMNEEIMVKWINEVLRKRSGKAFFAPENILVMDSMRAHLADGVKTACKIAKSKIAIIPGGLTKMLQPLDLAVNKSFKSGVRQQWENWMSCGNHDYTKSGHIKRATCSTICSWIISAWEGVPSSCVVSGFRTAGLPFTPIEEGDDDDDVNENGETNLREEFLNLFNSDSEDTEFEGFD